MAALEQLQRTLDSTKSTSPQASLTTETKQDECLNLSSSNLHNAMTVLAEAISRIDRLDALIAISQSPDTLSELQLAIENVMEPVQNFVAILGAMHGATATNSGPSSTRQSTEPSPSVVAQSPQTQTIVEPGALLAAM